jgi:iron complex outermembrane receptor protein
MIVIKPTALAITALTVMQLAASSAGAQDAAQTNGDNAQDTGNALEEVVVTAQRREESAQRAAIAISTLSGDAVASSNVTRPGGLTALVPSLQVADDTGPYSIFYVRGVGNFAASALSDAALSFNFDGVPVSRSGTSGFFYDLERVEVLKGPQGTLYGRNATGGAINVITKKPVLGKFGADASVQYGDYSSFRADGALNLPIGDTVAMRASAFHTQHDGYMKDGTDDQDDSGARLSFNFAPSDTLNANVVADYFQQGGQLSGGTVTGVTSSFVSPPAFSPGDRLGFFSPEVAAYLATQANALNGRTFAPFENVNHEDNTFWGVSASVDWETPIGMLTLVPAYRDSRLDYTSFATGVMLREQSEDKQKSFEARLASDSEQRLRYLLGVFYLDDDNDSPRFDVNQQSTATFQDYDLSTKSRAVFSSLTYAIVPDVRVTGGVRYTKDDKDFNGAVIANSIVCTRGFLACPTAPVFPYSQLAPVPPAFIPGVDGTITTLSTIDRTGANAESSSYSKVTWRAGADWDITEHNLLYASLETGFKAGGFFFSSDEAVFKPESLRAYTLGSKNRFLDNRLQLNLEAYYWKYHDQQISHLSTDSQNHVIFPTENVGLATFKGVEIDLQARPLRYTLLSTDVQYNHGVYDSFVYHTPNRNGGVSNGTGCPNVGAPGASYTVDCSGKQPPYAPRWSISGGVQQTVPMPADASLVGNARMHYQSTTLTALEFLPVEEQGGYSIWDFDLTYYAEKERYFGGVYVNNAFDKTALSFSFPTPLSGFMTATLQHPRVYGVRVGMHF